MRGLRIPVATVVGMVADGMTNVEILTAYPDLEDEDIHEALRFAADAVSERELPLVLELRAAPEAESPGTDERRVGDPGLIVERQRHTARRARIAHRDRADRRLAVQRERLIVHRAVHARLPPAGRGHHPL